jgi:hypothetical protein
VGGCVLLGYRPVPHLFPMVLDDAPGSGADNRVMASHMTDCPSHDSTLQAPLGGGDPSKQCQRHSGGRNNNEIAHFHSSRTRLLTKPGWRTKVAPRSKLYLLILRGRRIIPAGLRANQYVRRRMAKIAVYRFFWRHQETGEIVESPRFATLKAINQHDGRNIEDSRQIVDEGEIDEKGFLKNSKR